MKSFISNNNISQEEAIKGSDIRDNVFTFIQKQYPDFAANSYIGLDELNSFRRQYLASLLQEENAELNEIHSDVVNAIKQNSFLSETITNNEEIKLSFGDRLSDKIAEFGGSWAFIIIFFSFILVWMGINVWVLTLKPFDPYPFILLNLILSCIAAIQAPIIMMSQNRQEQKDRERAEHDYKINLKAELEIKLLSEKMDHLLIHQNKKLLEIQQVQVDYLEDVIRRINAK